MSASTTQNAKIQKTAIQNLIHNLSAHPDVKKLVGRFNKLAKELKSKQKELNVKINKNTEERIAQALTSYQDLVKTVNQAETKLETELNKAMKNLKTSATEVEKNLNLYKKKAIAKRSEIEKMLFNTKKKNSTSKKKSSAGSKERRKATKKSAK